MSETNHVSVFSCGKKELTSCRDPHCPIHGTPVEYVTVSSEQQGEEPKDCGCILADRKGDIMCEVQAKELSKSMIKAMIPDIMAKCAEEWAKQFPGWACQKNWIKNWRPE